MDTNLHFRLPDESERGQIDQLLADKFDFMVEPPISEKWTFHDTFDWRLFNGSLVLRHSGEELSLEHLSGGESLKGLAGMSPPEFTWDLPESKLRKRLEPIIKMRALLPLAGIRTRSRNYRILNPNKKTVARLVYTEVRAIDEKKNACPGNLFKLAAGSRVSKIFTKAGQISN